MVFEEQTTSIMSIESEIDCYLIQKYNCQWINYQLETK